MPNELIFRKGLEYSGEVKSMDFPNKGLVYTGNYKVFVKDALPGQTVRYRLLKKWPEKGEGSLIEVISRGNNELEKADCPHFPTCGGCLLRSLPYEEQLKLKEKEVLDLLEPVAEGYEYLGIIPSPKANEYRNKMEFSFGDMEKGGELTLGLHKRGSFYDIVNVPECRIVCPDFRKILVKTLEFAHENKLTYRHKNGSGGYLRHLVVRRAEKTGEILVNLVTTSDCTAEEDVLLKAYTEALLELKLDGIFAGIIHSLNNSVADVVMSEKTDILYGRDYFDEELLGLKFHISPFSFFQTNSLGAEVLYDTVRKMIGERKESVVYDLYSGTGTIAQLMAPVAKRVYGIEIIEEAVLAARENAVENGLNNCTFIAGDVLKKLDEIEERPDFIILDPPRDGINPKALKKILDYNVDSLIYVSCKPTSLARDLPEFTAAGYRPVKVAMVDMFPGTANVETVVLLVRELNNDDKTVSIKVDMDGYNLNRDEGSSPPFCPLCYQY
ncbi:MAG: 23S rRNA (uracil(1939)-C(5))-methyltransferase RlmD [Lachnospiraceae bacterium]|nr:23S rRNA (uracil(1939)-C(5))-methyltransferase RlmD [Lachnospiraceae bacterium]